MSTIRCASPNSDKPIKHFNNINSVTNEDSSKSINIYDITFYINRSLKQYEIDEILENIWKLKPNYKFPITEYNKKKFNFNFYGYIVNWLSNSKKLDDAFCKCCVAF